jgi:Class II flagellar assembly regulator
VHSSPINATRRTDEPRRSRRTGAAAGDRFSGLLDQLAGCDEAPAASAAAGTSPVGGLIGLCEVPTATDRPARRRALDRGADLLDQLDRLQLDILSGRIPTGRLIAMSQQVRARRDLSGDPRIEALIDAIELRVAVEVAKTGEHA